MEGCREEGGGLSLAAGFFLIFFFALKAHTVIAL